MNDFEELSALNETDETDLKKLALLLGCDPKYFYIGTDLSGADLRGSDLRGMHFDATNVLQAKLDLTTKFDPQIHKILRQLVSKRYLEVSDDLLDATELFFSQDKFASRGWFIKRIVPTAAIEISKRGEFWREVIDESQDLSQHFNSQDRRRIELMLNDLDYQAGLELGRNYGGRGSSLTALILVGLMRLVGFPESKVLTRPVTISKIYEAFVEEPQFFRSYLSKGKWSSRRRKNPNYRTRKKI